MAVRFPIRGVFASEWKQIVGAVLICFLEQEKSMRRC